MTNRPTTLAVAVKPNASSSGVSVDRGTVHVRVRAPARQGKANEACRQTLAAALGVAPSAITLIRGASARVKVFALSTLTKPELEARLARLQS